MRDYSGLLILAALTLVGIWAIVNPGGIIGRAKHAHPALSENDTSVQFVAKLVGALLVGLSVLILVAFVFGRYR
jgi:hypothetical protein